MKRQAFLIKDYNIQFTNNPSTMICLMNVGSTGNWGVSKDQLSSEILHPFKELILTPHFSFVVFLSIEEAVLFFKQYNFQKLAATGKIMLMCYCSQLLDLNPYPTKISNGYSYSFEELPGLYLLESIISLQQEQELLENLNKESIVCVKDRFIKHFGFNYNYSNAEAGDVCTPVPVYFHLFLRQLPLHIIGNIPNQFTISKYPPGSGIPAHVDTKDGFGPFILSLSLSSTILMDLVTDENIPYQVELNPRSLLIMSQESRYLFKHGIKERKSDILQDGSCSKRGVRWSITMRSVS